MSHLSPIRPVVVLLGRACVCAAVLVLTTGCSLKTMAVKTVANTLSAPGDVFTRDDDPDLIREATPFALKLYESLLESVPNHVPLLISTCGGFTQYGYAFLEAEADSLDASRRAEATALRERALKHYLRGRGYCLRGMDARFGKGTSAALLQNPEATVAKAKKDDVPLLYWTAASWGAAISLGIDRPDLAVDFPTVRALADRALALDPEWSRGSIHELMITLDSCRRRSGGNTNARPRPLHEGGRDSEGPVAGSVCLARNWRRRAHAGPRGVRAPAQGGTRDRSRKGPVESPRHPRHAAARASAARSCRREVLEMMRTARRKPEDTGGRMLVRRLALILIAVALVVPSLWAAVTIKMATQAPVNSSWHKVLLDMGAQWEAKTAGRVKLTVYAGGTQGSEDATIRMMRPGVDQLQQTC
jgi:hypothetical protein